MTTALRWREFNSSSTHSVCHGCLFSYIVNVCKSTEPRLRINCPLCIGSFDKSGDGAGLFSLNTILEEIVEKPDKKLCDPC